MSKKGNFGLAVKGKVNIVKLLIVLAVVAIVEFICFYFMLPAINFHDIGYWIFQAVFIVAVLFLTLDYGQNGVVRYSIVSCVLTGILLLGFLICIVGGISSMVIFNAGRYSSLIEVEERDFATDLPSSDTVNDIALMDTDSARVVGQRAIGSLSDVVSQYQISESYSTIDYNGEPMKVASLEYADFFKWLNNRDQGIPGYVFVDPVDFEAKYVKLDKTIRYTPSGYFNDNLERHLRFQYPTAIFEGYYFEVDNDGNPYYICPTLTTKVSLFGAYDVSGVVVCDPCTGDSTFYDVDEVPNWVDRVYDGELATQKYNWYGELSGGFINSVIGQEGCKMTTDDYGYKVMDGDIWVYTGVTSVIGDQSNVGFVLINARTCKAIYYTIAGAEEYSAMEAAEGQVQNLGYSASFPSLINVNGEPTYLMVLKDKSNLVKMYAMVNMEKYSIVATGTSQKETMASYKKLLASNKTSSTSDSENSSKTIQVEDIKFIDIEGDTYAYVSDTEGSVYKQLFSDNESLILLKTGDFIKVEYVESEDKINSLISFEKLQSAENEETTKNEDTTKNEETIGTAETAETAETTITAK